MNPIPWRGRSMRAGYANGDITKMPCGPLGRTAGRCRRPRDSRSEPRIESPQGPRHDGTLHDQVPGGARAAEGALDPADQPIVGERVPARDQLRDPRPEVGGRVQDPPAVAPEPGL